MGGVGGSELALLGRIVMLGLVGNRSCIYGSRFSFRFASPIHPPPPSPSHPHLLLMPTNLLHPRTKRSLPPLLLLLAL